MKPLFTTLLVLTTTISLSASEGALQGHFTINADGDQVVFSQGNLQYQASTKTWRFAENQYDYIGEDNKNIAENYSGWIDLFGWGTGNHPLTNSIENAEDYNTFTDWGENPISNGGNTANLWRTLTKDEWVYLFQTRRNASKLFGMGSVNSVNGMIILPDDWTAPDGLTFNASTAHGLDDLGIHFSNESLDNFTHNTYSLEQWAIMESAYAVFLPTTGGRFGVEIYNVGQNGHYWSSDSYNEYFSHLMYFDSQYLFPQAWSGRYRGFSVRLVQKAETTVLDNIQEAQPKTQKIIRNGQILILLPDGRTYNIYGTKMEL